MRNYSQDAASDAREWVSHFEDEILEMLIEKGEASDDYNNDYPNGDSYHHENHIDKWYSLTDAAKLLDELSEHEENDRGLWEGQEMKEALSTCAAFTYGNAVSSKWSDLIKDINDRAVSIIDDFDTEQRNLESAIDDLESEIEDAETKCEKKALIRERAEKRSELDSLDDRKSDALREMIQEVAKEE